MCYARTLIQQASAKPVHRSWIEFDAKQCHYAHICTAPLRSCLQLRQLCEMPEQGHTSQQPIARSARQPSRPQHQRLAVVVARRRDPCINSGLIRAERPVPFWPPGMPKHPNIRHRSPLAPAKGSPQLNFFNFCLCRSPLCSLFAEQEKVTAPSRTYNGMPDSVSLVRLREVCLTLCLLG